MLYDMNKTQKIVIGIILVIITIIIINYVYSRNTEAKEKEDVSEENTVIEETKEPEKKEIVVHIAGAVQTEGIVFLEEGDRVSNAIEKAGGTTQEADMSQVNLAYELEDGEKIYIPKKGEEVEMQQEETITTETKEEKPTTSKTNSQSKTNINKATQEELENLPGIGPSTASKIIEHREKNGKFKEIEDIKDVSGIGEAKFNSIRDLISV